MAIDFGKFKGASAQKSLEAQANTPRETQGGFSVGHGIFDFTNAPFPIKGYKPKLGKNVVLILPIEVTNKQNPAYVAGAIDLGAYDYGVSVAIHFGKNTAAGLGHVCLKNNYWRPCPRCDEYFLPPEKGGTFVKGSKGTGNQDHRKSDRNYFLVVPYDDSGKVPDTENVGIWDAPAGDRKTRKGGFLVVDAAKQMSDGDAMIPFWWPTDEGRLVQFEAFQDGEWMGYNMIKFLKRDTAKVQELADKYSFPLDSMLIVKTPDQINEDVFGGPEREGSHEDKHEDTTTEETPEEDGMDPDAFGAPEPPKEEKLVEAPAEKPKAIPAPEASKAPEGGSKCPYGHNYGTDWGDTPNCKSCRREHKDLEAECAEGGN